eukprot:s4109_g4.t1
MKQVMAAELRSLWTILECPTWLWRVSFSVYDSGRCFVQRAWGSLSWAFKGQDLEGCDRIKELLIDLDQWPTAAAGDFEVVEDLLEDLKQCPEAEDSELRACLRALLAAYARSPRNLKDEKVQLLVNDCLSMLEFKSSRDASALGDARRALGRDGYQRLAKKLGLAARNPREVPRNLSRLIARQHVGS